MADDIEPIVEWNRETDADGNLFNQEFSNIYNPIPSVIDTSSEILQMKKDGTAGFERVKLPEYLLGIPEDFDFDGILHNLKKNGTFLRYEDIKNKKLIIVSSDFGSRVESSSEFGSRVESPTLRIKFKDSDLNKNFYLDISASFAKGRTVSVAPILTELHALSCREFVSFSDEEPKSLSEEYNTSSILKGWYTLKRFRSGPSTLEYGVQFFKLI